MKFVGLVRFYPFSRMKSEHKILSDILQQKRFKIVSGIFIFSCVIRDRESLKVPKYLHTYEYSIGAAVVFIWLMCRILGNILLFKPFYSNYVII